MIYLMNWWTELSKYIEPYFLIGSLRLNYYGLFIGIGILAATWLAQKRAHLYNLKKTDIKTTLWWAIIPGFIGARLYHVIDYWSYYIARPFEITAIWNGGLGIYGGIIGGLLGIACAAKLKKIKLMPLLDLAVPSLSMAQAIGRWGNFFNMEAYGPPTDLPWKIYISPANRLAPYINNQYFHPTFLYESLWNFLTLTFLLFISKHNPIPGTVTGWYLILYGIGRFAMEFARLDTATLYGFKVAQIISITAIIIGILLINQKTTFAKITKIFFIKN